MKCGIDEAGRGPVMGPMVVAGVLVNNEDELIDLKVKDSKMLSPDRRESLAKEIKQCSTYTIRVFTAEEMDEMRAEKSLNQIEAELFASIIDELCDNMTTAYLDAASTDEEKFERMVSDFLEDEFDIISRHAADESYPCVSAASIIAKTKRDQKMKDIEEKLDSEIGSGYPSDMRTKNFLNRWAEEKGELPPYTRKSWQTAKEVMNRVKTKSLDDF